MGKIRMIVGALAALAMLALAAAPAMAHQFVAAGKTGKTAGKGFEEVEIPGKPEQPEFAPERMQEFKLGKFRVLCYKARSKGETTLGGSPTFQTTTKYSKCGWYPNTTAVHIGATFNKAGLTVNYHANGYAELLGDGEGESFEYKGIGVRENAAEIKISSNKACTIAIPEQTVPVRAEKFPEEEYSAVIYTNEEVPTEKLRTFPSGFQKKVLFTHEVKGLRFKYIGEETQCANLEEFEKLSEEEGGGAGSYKGKLLQEVLSGDLSWE